MTSIEPKEYIVKILSESFIDKKESFIYYSPDCILHKKSNIFYDPENYAVGYLFFTDNDEQSDPEYRIINLDEDSITMINESFLSWYGWYEKERHMELLNKFVEK